MLFKAFFEASPSLQWGEEKSLSLAPSLCSIRDCLTLDLFCQYRI
jgi:hypothetical protein